jgi:hypothetical protein
MYRPVFQNWHYSVGSWFIQFYSEIPNLVDCSFSFCILIRNRVLKLGALAIWISYFALFYCESIWVCAVSSLNYVSPMVQPSGNSIPMLFGRVVIAVQQIHNTRHMGWDVCNESHSHESHLCVLCCAILLCKNLFSYLERENDKCTSHVQQGYNTPLIWGGPHT